MHKINFEAYAKALNKLVLMKEITKDTASKYLSCMNIIYTNTNGNIDIKVLNDFLTAKLNDDRQFVQYISAIRKYEEYVLKQPRSILFGDQFTDLVMHFKDKAHGKRSGSGITNDTITRKINAIRNEKLKLAFRLQLKSGLRVKEISDLMKDDVFFYEDGSIQVNVKNGKGNKPRTVNVRSDEYLYVHLKKYIENCEDEKLFYSRSYLKQKAVEYGIQTHDMRRYNAKNRLKDEIENGKSQRAAKREVQKELGHENVKTTDLYLGKDF